MAKWILANVDNTGLCEIQRNDEEAPELTDDDALEIAECQARLGDDAAIRAIQRHHQDEVALAKYRRKSQRGASG